MRTAIFPGLEKYRDFGLLIIRVGIGALFILFGFPKITGGPEFWAQIGSAMSNFGVDFGHTFWGFMAALAEFGGGILMIFGLFFRVAMLLLIFTMFVAFYFHFAKGDGFQEWSHAVEFLIVFLGLFFTGPGRLSVDKE